MVTFLLSLLVIGSITLMLYAAVALVQDKRLFGTAPKAAQQRVQPKPERFKGQHRLGWALILLSMLLLAAAAFWAVWDGVRSGFGFWQFFARFLTILYAYKAYDMICFDWLLMTRTRFFQHYYPEIEGCEEFARYGFNLKSQLLRIAAYPFVCALVAWLCVRG